jgi:excisionase family DNA binding protein
MPSFEATASLDEFKTIPQLASEWHVTEQHLYNLVKDLRLPAYRVGRRLIVKRADAQDFLQRNATIARAA